MTARPFAADELAGAESILQLRAMFLSDDDRISRYFANRPGSPFRKKQRTKEDTVAQTVE